MFTFNNIPESEIKLFYEALEDQSLMRRAQAIVEQRKAAKAAQAVGGQKVSRGKWGSLKQRPIANIDPAYYHSRMAQEREASDYRMRTGENVWSDPEFMEYELRKNPELRPVLDDRNAPVHMNGVEIPTQAAFEKLKSRKADTLKPKADKDTKYLIKPTVG